MLKWFIKRVSLLLAALCMCSSFNAWASLTCGIDGTNANVTVFDFNTFPSQINTNVPVGTVIYSKDYNTTVWCGKDIDSTIGKTEEIFITRTSLVNILGADSGLAMYVIINGEGGSNKKSYGTGVSTAIPWANGGGNNWKDILQRVDISVTIQLVKVGENVALQPSKKKPALFSVGSSGGGKLTFYMDNTGKLTFGTQTCEVTGDGNYTADLDALNISDIRENGPVAAPTVGLNVEFICNSNLWSSQSINMKITGASVPGLESNGVFKFNNKGSSTEASGIALRLLQGAKGQTLTPVVPGQSFEIGNFVDALARITVPLQAGYYVTAMDQLSEGVLQATLIYQVDYQ